MTLDRSPKQYVGVRPTNPPNVIYAARPPTSTDKAYVRGDLWEDLVGLASWQYAGAGVWIALGTGATGGVVTLTGDSGTASPSAGNIKLAGTANQITSAASGSTVTFTIPATFIAPGSIASTTTITSGTSMVSTTTITAGTGITSTTGNISATAGAVNAGTSMTATLGDITASNGNFVSSTSGKGLLLNSPAASGVAASPVVVNGRSGQATFTTVSIAAAADLTLTITNSAITGATTQVIYSMSGATTGSALSIKSVTNSAGSSAIVVTNGTGATTTTADIVMNFLVVN